MNSLEKQQLLQGMFNGAQLTNVQVIGVAESGAKVVYQEVHTDAPGRVAEEQVHFPACLNFAQGERVLSFLKEHGFVAPTTDPANFLYQMGATDELPSELAPLLWIKNKQLLREMLELWFGRLLAEGSLKKARLEAICSQVFVDDDGKMIHLAKNKAVPSVDSDELVDFFATIPRPEL